jgi:chemotaxis signal transduction protein
MDRLTNELVAIIADEVATSIRIVEAQAIAQRALAGAGHAYSRGMVRGHEEALVELRRIQRRCDMVREALLTKAAVDRRVEAEGA